MLNAGQVIIVTGGLGGIGFAAAKMLLERGACVTLADRAEASPRQREILERYAERHVLVHCDVTLRSDVENTVARTLQAFGRIDGLVNSAGIDRRTPLFDVTDEAF